MKTFKTVTLILLIGLINSCSNKKQVNKEKYPGLELSAAYSITSHQLFKDACLGPNKQKYLPEYTDFLSVAKTCPISLSLKNQSITVTEENAISFQEAKRCIRQLTRSYNKIHKKAQSKPEYRDCRDALRGSSQKISSDEKVGSLKSAYISIILNFLDPDKALTEEEKAKSNSLSNEKLEQFFSLIARWSKATRNNVYSKSSDKRTLEEVKSEIKELESPEGQYAIKEELTGILSNNVSHYDGQIIDYFRYIHNNLWKVTRKRSELTSIYRLGKDKDYQIESEEALINDKIIVSSAIQKEDNVPDLNIVETVIKVQTQLLSAAFKSELAQEEYFSEDILSILTGEAINPLFDRAKIMADILDATCKLRGSCFDLDNNVFYISKFFSELAQGSIPQLRPTGSIITKNFMSFLIENASTLKKINDGLLKTYGSKEQEQKILSSHFNPPYFSESLISVYQNSHRLYSNVKTTGFFSGKSIVNIDYGLDLEKIKLNLNKFNEKKLPELKRIIEQNEVNKEKLYAAIESTEQETIAQETRVAELNKLLKKHHQTQRSLESYQDAISNNHATFTNDYQYWKDIVKKSSEKQDTITEAVNKSFNIKATDIPLGADNKVKIDHMSITLGEDQESLSKITAQKGDILIFSATKEWQAGCAVKKDYGVDSAQVGPSGYKKVKGFGEAKVESVDKYRTKEKSTEKYASVEASASAGFSIPAAGGFGASITATAGVRSSSRTARGTRQSTMNSKTRSSQASFNMGIRSAYTPFPNFPVGSLLAVTMKSGGKELKDILDVHVIDSKTTVKIGQNSDIYIVGNDCNGGNQKSELSLELRYIHNQNAVSGLTDIITAIDKVIKDETNTLSNYTKRVLAGTIDHNTLNEFESLVRASVLSDTAITKSAHLVAIENFLLSHEKNLLHLKSQISNTRMLLESIERDIYSLAKTIDSKASIGIFKEGLRNRIVSNIDRYFIKRAGSSSGSFIFTLDDILEQLNDDLLPLILLRFEDQIEDLKNNKALISSLNALQNLDFSASMFDVSNEVYNFSKELADFFEDQVQQKISTTTFRQVLLSIPNPYTPKTDEGRRNEGDDSNTIVPSQSSIYTGANQFNGRSPSLSIERAKIIWDQLFPKPGFKDPVTKAVLTRKEKHRLKIKIRPSDLFVPYSPSSLDCEEKNVIVEGVGVYLLGNSDAFSKGTSSSVRTETSGRFTHIMRNGTLEYTLPYYENSKASSFYKSFRVPIWIQKEFPDESTIAKNLGSKRQFIGKGITPFTDFNINFKSLFAEYNQRKENYISRYFGIEENEIEEILLAFYVTVEDRNLESHWLKQCL